jgi:1-aminocyclopropane-1-carboxylate deaminase/D-cysteine desulfhydrase-like pyridoxal-dependent ACC family enzyme
MPQENEFMSKNYIAEAFPRAVRPIPFRSIVPVETPVEKLEALGRRFGHPTLYVKREDQTHSVYGGNKVRNLEFVLAETLARGKNRIVTLVPKGSNFTAALSAHGKLAGIEIELSQFVALENPQIEAHFEFSREHGARMGTFRGRSGPVAAAAQSFYRGLNPKADYIAPGASSVTGALGHANAFLELAAQARKGLVPMPDYLVVGAGTCGTTAGLLAGIQIARAPTRVIAVRCAERIVCNRPKIERLALAVLDRLALKACRPFRFELVESPENLGYAVPSIAARGVMDTFLDAEGIELDTTYTSKVALYLKHAFEKGEFRGKSLLYWHTFSPAALTGRRGVM